MSGRGYAHDLDPRGEVEELQNAVKLWSRRNFPDATPEMDVLGTCEEVGELARAALKRKLGVRGTQDEWLVEIQKECGDVFLKLCGVADAYGFSLHAAIVARWSDVSRRDFITDPIGHGLPT